MSQGGKWGEMGMLFFMRSLRICVRTVRTYEEIMVISVLRMYIRTDTPPHPHLRRGMVRYSTV